MTATSTASIYAFSTLGIVTAVVFVYLAVFFSILYIVGFGVAHLIRAVLSNMRYE